MKLYRSFREEVPDEAYEVPLDKAAVTREGTDVSIITTVLWFVKRLKQLIA